MIPLRDDNPTRTVSFVTIALIALNALVFLHELSLAHAHQLPAFLADFALVPASLSTSFSGTACRSVFTSMFLHGGWLHLIGNMLYLWIFGNNIEDAVGHGKFILFYLLCGIAAAAGQVLISPHSTVPMIGASGAISGVLGAYLLLFPRARVLVLLPLWIFWRTFYVPAVLVLALWFALQLFNGLALRGVHTSGGVAFWAHIGGFIAGLVLILLFKKRDVRMFQ